MEIDAAWDTAKNNYLLNLEQYTFSGTDESPNPEYDPEAELIGRRYAIPQVDLGNDITDYPEILPKLVHQQIFSTGATGSINLGKPYIVYKYTGDSNYRTYHGVSIKDNEVMLQKPIFRITDVDAVEFPSEIFLECSYKLHTELRETVTKQGSISKTISRYFFEPEKFFHKSKINWFSPYKVGNVVYATYNGSTTVTKNDAALAQTYGLNKLQEYKDPQLETTWDSIGLDLSPQLGQVVRENGVTSDPAQNIVRIEYTLDNSSNYKTTCTAMSR